MRLLSLISFSLLAFLNMNVAHSSSARIPRQLEEKLAIVQADPDFLALKARIADSPEVEGAGKFRAIPRMSVVTPAQAEEIVTLLKKYMPGETYDGLCFVRNYYWHLILDRLSLKTGSVTIRGVLSSLRPRERDIRWSYHIAPVICTEASGGRCRTVAVLDASFRDRPMSLFEWEGVASGDTPLIRKQLVDAGFLSSPRINPDKPFTSTTQDHQWSAEDISTIEQYLPYLKFTY